MKHTAALLLFQFGTADTSVLLRQQLIVATRAARAATFADATDRAETCWQFASAAWQALVRRGATAACAVDGIRYRKSAAAGHGSVTFFWEMFYPVP